MSNRDFWMQMAVIYAIRHLEREEKELGYTSDSCELASYRELLKTLKVSA